MKRFKPSVPRSREMALLVEAFRQLLEMNYDEETIRQTHKGIFTDSQIEWALSEAKKTPQTTEEL